MRTVELIAYTQVTQLLEGGKRSQTRGLTPGQVVKAMQVVAAVVNRV